MGTLRVRVLTEGVHSGMATGIAPTPFRILEQLLARIENPVTGDLLLEELQVNLPQDRRAQVMRRRQGARATRSPAKCRGRRACSRSRTIRWSCIINSTWRATLAVTGADGLPPLGSAGNVLLPEVAFKLSLRLPPTCDAERATQRGQGDARARSAVRRAGELRGGVGHRRLECSGTSRPGWRNRSPRPRVRSTAGRRYTSAAAARFRSWACWAQRFPQTQFFITGVLGPHANAHGPNEFLHVDYAKKLTACVSLVLADHARTVA